LYDTLLEQSLLRIIEPYSVVEIVKVAELVGQDQQAVEGKCVPPFCFVGFRIFVSFIPSCCIFVLSCLYQRVAFASRRSVRVQRCSPLSVFVFPHRRLVPSSWPLSPPPAIVSDFRFSFLDVGSGADDENLRAFADDP
jgi:hypothetical protein